MKNTIRSLSVMVAILSVLAGNAQGRMELSLVQAQDYAVKNSFQTKTTVYDAESAGYNTESLKAIGLPQINGSMQFSNYIYAPYSIIPAGTFGPNDLRVRFGNPYSLTIGATANQILFDGTWLVALQASKNYQQYQNQLVKKSEIDVKGSIADAYSLALIAQENVKLLKDAKVELVSTLNQTEALLTEGFTEAESVDQLQLAVNELNIQTSYAEEQAKLANDLLKFQAGIPLATELVLTDNLESFMSSSAGDLLNTTFNAESTIGVQIANKGLELQVLNLRSKKAAYLPNLGAFVNVQTAAYRQDFNFFDTKLPFFYGNLWGLQMNVPILSGGKRKYEVKKVEVEVKRMQDMSILAKQSAELEFRSSRSELSNALAAYNSSKSSMELAKSILNKTQIKFKEGLGTSFDVTERNRQLITTQGNYVQSMMKVLNARTRLAKALNQL